MASEFNKYTTSQSPVFRARVEMALLHQAQYVLLLEPAPTDGSVVIAQRVLGSTVPIGESANRMARLIAADVTLADEISGDVSGALLSDAQLTTAVATHFLKLA